MTRVKSIIGFSALGFVMASGVALSGAAWAAKPWGSEIAAARKSMQEAILHLNAADAGKSAESDMHRKRALALLEMARTELETVGIPLAK